MIASPSKDFKFVWVKSYCHNWKNLKGDWRRSLLSKCQLNIFWNPHSHLSGCHRAANAHGLSFSQKEASIIQSFNCNRYLAKFKSTLPIRSEVDGRAVRCQNIMVSCCTCYDISQRHAYLQAERVIMEMHTHNCEFMLEDVQSTIKWPNVISKFRICYLEIKPSDWLKLITWPAVSNQSALCQLCYSKICLWQGELYDENFKH